MGKKILVVDDNIDILEALEMTLSFDNHCVFTTHRADHALEKVMEIMPDIIVLDVLMSGVDGRDICRKLKQSVVMSKIPVLMISAHPSAEESVKKVGADAFLAKPFDMDSFLDRINKLSN